MVHFCMLEKEIHPMGPQLIEMGMQIAARLGKHAFTESNGWLELCKMI